MYHFTVGVDKRVSCDTHEELMQALGSNGAPKAIPTATVDNPVVGTTTEETDEERIAKLPYESGRLHWRTRDKIMAEHNYSANNEGKKQFQKDMAARRKLGR